LLATTSKSVEGSSGGRVLGQQAKRCADKYPWCGPAGEAAGWLRVVARRSGCSAQAAPDAARPHVAEPGRVDGLLLAASGRGRTRTGGAVGELDRGLR